MRRVYLAMGLAAVLAVTAPVLMGQGRDAGEVRVMFWNLENFFDFIDGGAGESDSEFSATGPRRWTKKRFYRKCNAVAKTILWAGSACGALPDVVGGAEVENRFVLRQLVEKTALRKLDYEIVHFDSPDPRGIDCALLYRASRLTLVSAKPCRVSAPDLQTRDILLAQFLTADRDSLAVLVNHHPSKYGGGETDWRREVAVARLRALGDSLAAAGWTSAVAVGDFNDTPDNPLFQRLSPAFSLCRQVPFAVRAATASVWENYRPAASSSAGKGAPDSRLLDPLPGGADPTRENVRPEASSSAGKGALDSRLLDPLPGGADPTRENVRPKASSSAGKGAPDSRLLDSLPGDADPTRENARPGAPFPEGKRQYIRGSGSIRFNGEWQLIDLCFVSPALAESSAFMVLEPPFLTERDAGHSGERPLRTYSGPRYRGGVSDHRPILVRITFPHLGPKNTKVSRQATSPALVSILADLSLRVLSPAEFPGSVHLYRVHHSVLCTDTSKNRQKPQKVRPSVQRKHHQPHFM